MSQLNRADLDDAAAIVRRHFPGTPQYCWPLLSEAVGAEVWVKHEDATPVGAFKVRGGLVFMNRHRDLAGSGIISATKGNHGQSLAFAGRAYGVPVTIVVPEGNSPDRTAVITALGADLIVGGRDFQAAAERASAEAEQRGLDFVPSFHPDLVAGVATYALELFAGAPPLDAVYVPIGLGSGICGLIGVRDLLGLPTEIIGVVADGAPTYALSVAAGRVVATPNADTFVDGVACRQPDPVALDIIRAGAARVIRVPDEATADAMRLCYRTTHHLPEPAGAIALAGLCVEAELQAGRRVGVILTGANMDTTTAIDVLAGSV